MRIIKSATLLITTHSVCTIGDDVLCNELVVPYMDYTQ